MSRICIPARFIVMTCFASQALLFSQSSKRKGFLRHRRRDAVIFAKCYS